ADSTAPCTLLSQRRAGRQSTRSIALRLRPAPGTMARPACGPSTTRITTALLCLILMVTTSRPSATRPLETKPEVLDVSQKVDAGCLIKLCNLHLNQIPASCTVCPFPG